MDKTDGKYLDVVQSSKDLSRRRTFTHAMHEVEIVRLKAASIREQSRREEKIKAAEEEQMPKTILTKIIVRKKTKTFSDHGTKPIFVVNISLHLNKERVYLVATSTAPSRSFCTSIKLTASPATNSRQPLSTATSINGRDAMNTHATDKTATNETVTITIGIIEHAFK